MRVHTTGPFWNCNETSHVHFLSTFPIYVFQPPLLHCLFLPPRDESNNRFSREQMDSLLIKEHQQEAWGLICCSVEKSSCYGNCLSALHLGNSIFHILTAHGKNRYIGCTMFRLCCLSAALLYRCYLLVWSVRWSSRAPVSTSYARAHGKDFHLSFTALECQRGKVNRQRAWCQGRARKDLMGVQWQQAFYATRKQCKKWNSEFNATSMHSLWVYCTIVQHSEWPGPYSTAHFVLLHEKQFLDKQRQLKRKSIFHTRKGSRVRSHCP